MENLKELREKCRFYVERNENAELQQEYEDILQLIDERIKGDAIHEEALVDISLYPQTDGDNTRDIADSMRVMAITALDETREFRYGLKNDR